jgi:hypothetical protein
MAGIAETLAVCVERLGLDATGVLSRLGSPLADACATSLRQLDSLDPKARARRRAEIAAIARAPVPPGLRLVHSSWIEAALGQLPPRARAAIAAPASSPIDVWLARFATASVPTMPAIPLTEIERIVVRDPDDVVRWLSSIGADQLAFALGSAAATHPRLADAAARIAKPPRVHNLGPQRSSILRCQGVRLDDELALIVVGSRALASHLRDDLVGRMQLVRRIPRAIGIVVDREISTASIEGAPSWAALAAP